MRRLSQTQIDKAMSKLTKAQILCQAAVDLLDEPAGSFYSAKIQAATAADRCKIAYDWVKMTAARQDQEMAP